MEIPGSARGLGRKGKVQLYPPGNTEVAVEWLVVVPGSTEATHVNREGKDQLAVIRLVLIVFSR